MLARVPPILYGTAWKKEQTTALVVQAVLAGFTGIDTAAQPKASRHYSQALVGDALKILKAEHGVERETLWLQTKFTGLAGQDLTKPIPYDKDAALDIQVRQSLEASLAELSTTYLDSLIMHSPMKTRAETAVVWREFEKFVESGKVRYLGISNISNPEDLEWMFQTFTIKPFIVQNPFTDRDQFSFLTLSLCEIYGAKFQSFWTLAIKPSLLRSPHLRTLAPEYTQEQALFLFLTKTERFGNNTIVPLSGTSSGKHMADDVEVMRRSREELGSGAGAAVRAFEKQLWG